MVHKKEKLGKAVCRVGQAYIVGMDMSIDLRTANKSCLRPLSRKQLESPKYYIACKSFSARCSIAALVLVSSSPMSAFCAAILTFLCQCLLSLVQSSTAF